MKLLFLLLQNKCLRPDFLFQRCLNLQYLYPNFQEIVDIILCEFHVNLLPDFFRAYESLSANKTFSNSGILIYPNPFYECLNILVGNSEVNGLKLYDTSAKLVYETSWLVIGDNAAALALSDELSHLSPGTYYLNFLNDSSVLKSDKIIKLPN